MNNDKPLRTVVFINGNPRVGKDTFANLVIDIANERGMQGENISTIDPIRNMFQHAGINVTNKTPELRKALSVVGEELESLCNFRTNRTVGLILAQAHTLSTKTKLTKPRESIDPVTAESCIWFVHVREGKYMDKMKAMLEPEGFTCIAILLKSQVRGEVVESNESDANVADYPYDILINNNSDLEALNAGAFDFFGYCLNLPRKAA